MRRTSNAPCESNAEGPCAFLSDTLAQSLFLFCVMTVLNRFIGFCRGILMCRWLEPAELGQWDMVQGFLMLAAPVAVLGIPGTFGRYLEYYRQRGQLRMLFGRTRSEEHTSELQSRLHLVCRLLLENKRLQIT